VANISAGVGQIVAEIMDSIVNSNSIGEATGSADTSISDIAQKFLNEGVHEIADVLALKEDTCPMCYDPYTLCSSQEVNADPTDTAVRIDPCGHILGLQCLRNHVAQAVHEYSNKCPVCRTELFQTKRRRDMANITQSLTTSLQSIRSQMTDVQKLEKRCDIASDKDFPVLYQQYAGALMYAVDLYNEHLDFSVDVWNGETQDFLVAQSRDLDPLIQEIEKLEANKERYEKRWIGIHASIRGGVATSGPEATAPDAEVAESGDGVAGSSAR
jgi:hypothetical protein